MPSFLPSDVNLRKEVKAGEHRDTREKTVVKVTDLGNGSGAIFSDCKSRSDNLWRELAGGWS